ncbi:TPA: hypothetical protein DIV49_03980 [Candidatus Saccharibacteria bacterium]|nr:hypothetical protein [Candidatus Saccharibacteria bacterium]HRF28089.1 hypothetical protein [Candidatus Saccharibacteria bacterium]HRJ90672.1 hypothetical protein [Candidatus Saccharibacteria bacterium]
MKRKLQVLLGTGVLLLGIVGTTLVPATSTVAALNPSDAVKDGVTDSGGGAGSGPGLRAQLKTVVNILLFVLGSIAVIMIVVGGIRYALSAGDSSAITAAKNTILYAIIGVVVALLAYAIVNWIIDQFA